MNKLNQSRQDGAVLVIALLLLIVITLVGVTAMDNVINQENMAYSFSSHEQALNASESALRAGERWLWEQTSRPRAGVQVSASDAVLDGGLNPVRDFWDDRNWPVGPRVIPHPDAASFAELDETPVYIIEELDVPPGSTGIGAGGGGGSVVVYEGAGGGAGASAPAIRYFRITSRATGYTGNEYILTQSTYALTF